MKRTIKEGAHYCNALLGRILPHTGTYRAHWIIPPSAFLASSKSQQINKLCGIASWRGVHYNSLRIGWQATTYPADTVTFDNQQHVVYKPAIQLFAYEYCKCVRTITPLFLCTQEAAGISLQVAIWSDGHALRLLANDGHTGAEYLASLKMPSVWFQCFPYFGGTEASSIDLDFIQLL